MGSVGTIAYDRFPRQGRYLGRKVEVCFHHDIENRLYGVVVRDDVTRPFRTIIHLQDGRFVLSDECQYRVVEDCMSSARRNLLHSIKSHAVYYGDFTLSSGKKSSYYIDLRQITLNGIYLQILLDALVDRLGGTEFQAIGGPTVGADPIVGGYLARHNVRGFLVRQESKDHGRGGKVLGSVVSGDKCVLVEDVTTTGESLKRAVEVVVQDMDCEVVQAITIVDREQGARDWFQAAGIKFYPLFNVSEVV